MKFLGLFEVSTPGNVNGFLQFLSLITGFELLDYEDIVTSLGYIPEDDPYNLNF